MAIATVRGATASLSVAGTSLAFASAAQTSGDTTVIAISLLSTTASVSSISDGTNTGVFRAAKNDSTVVRTELWTLPIASSASRTITINFSGSTLASAAYEEYSGPTGVGNIGTGAAGSGTYAEGDVAMQDTSSWAVCAIAAATLSGDTFAADLGTIRQSVIPALTTSAVALVDNTSIATVTLRQAIILSTARGWAAVALELRTGVAASPPTVPTKLAPETTTQYLTPPPAYSGGTGGAVPVPVAAALKGGTTGVAYSETITAQGGTAPYTFAVTSGSLPASLSMSSGGIISGTPTIAATSSFTVTATDATLATGSTAFQITIAAPASGGSSPYAG